MSTKQLAALVFCSLVPWWVGSALMPLLPLYAASLGASPVTVGNYLSFIFLSLAIGTLFAGWLSGRTFHLRRWVALCSAVAVVSTYLMGQTTVLWRLLCFNAVAWFAGGVVLTLIAILAGRHAGEDERGKVFGLLAMTTALGGVLAGPAGAVVEQWGYLVLFSASATIWLGALLAADFLPDAASAGPVVQPQSKAARIDRLGMAFNLLILAALCFGIGSFVASLGRSLSMDVRGFPAGAITWIAALGSIVAMVVNPIIGRLSDRISRRLLLSLIYAIGALALVMMAGASSLALFALISVLQSLSSAERALSSALTVDLLPPHALHHGLSMLDAVKWLGGVAGFALAGYAVQAFGLQQALWISASLPVLAILLLAAGRRRPGGQPSPVPVLQNAGVEPLRR